MTPGQAAERLRPVDANEEMLKSGPEAVPDHIRSRNELYQGLILLANGYVENIPAAERFRILRAKIERQNLKERKYQVLAVTSAMPAEGKSVVSVNLARALSVDHLGKTLIIDCDLRKPSVHEFFRVSREPGISDALFSKRLSSNLIRSVGPGLDVITAGSPVVDPAQTIEQPELSVFLSQLRRYYRYIIIDCPPVLFCPEPISLSCLADASLLVVRAGRTDKRMVRDAVEVLGESRVMGTVFNEASDPSRQYLDYSYYGYKAAK